jgi:hypothetical protein
MGVVIVVGGVDSVDNPSKPQYVAACSRPYSGCSVDPAQLIFLACGKSLREFPTAHPQKRQFLGIFYILDDSKTDPHIWGSVFARNKGFLLNSPQRMPFIHK